MSREIIQLFWDLQTNHTAIDRPISIYSRALDEIKRSHEFIREFAWRFSDHASANWSGPDVQANVADFFGITVNELDKEIANEESDDTKTYDLDGELIFTNCNVCGCRLRNDDENRMGMCERCAAE